MKLTQNKFVLTDLRAIFLVGLFMLASVDRAQASCPDTGTVASDCTNLNWNSGDVTINTDVAVTSTGNFPILVTGSSPLGTLTNNGSVSGYGAFYSYGGANIAAITNNGTMTGSEYEIYNYSGPIGTFTNNGLLTGGYKNIFFYDSVGTFVNNGTISGASQYGIFNIGSVGSFANNLTINSGLHAVYNLGTISSFSNSGTIFGSLDAINNQSSIGSSSTANGVDNTGTISKISNEIGGVIDGSFAGIYNSNTIGDTNYSSTTGIQNAGTIGTSSSSYGILNAGSITNISNLSSGLVFGNSSSIYNTGTGTIGDTNYSSTTGIQNAGTIGTSSSSYGIYNQGQITNISNLSGGAISGSYGILNTSTIGDVNNSSATGIQNAGSIGSSSGSIGISNAGGITNIVNSSSGVIGGGSYAIYNAGTIGDVNNSSATGIQNAGTIGTSSSYYGIWNDTNARITNISNLGGIIEGSSAGIWNLGNIGDINYSSITGIQNSGIIGSSSSSYGIHNSGSITNLVNSSGGVIDGGIAGIDNSGTIGDMTNSSNTGIQNSGTIGSSGNIAGINNNSASVITNIANLANANIGSAGSGIYNAGIIGDTNNPSATGIQNAGTIGTNYSVYGIWNDTGGLITSILNLNSASILGIGNGILNNGTINSLENYYQILGFGSDGITNAGGTIGRVFNAPNSVIANVAGGGSGIYNNGLLENIDNQGTISSGLMTGGGANAIYNDTTGVINSLNNQNGGLIQVSETGSGVGGSCPGSSGAPITCLGGITNAGSISALNNTGVLTKIEGAYAGTAPVSGMLIYGVGNFNGAIGDLTNSNGATISARSTDVNNLNTFSVAAAGIYQPYGTIGTLSNSGTNSLIQGLVVANNPGSLAIAAGIASDGSILSITNQNEAVISGIANSSGVSSSYGVINGVNGNINILENKSNATISSVSESSSSFSLAYAISNEGAINILRNTSGANISAINSDLNSGGLAVGIYNSGSINLISNDAASSINATAVNSVSYGIYNSGSASTIGSLNNAGIISAGSGGYGIYNEGAISSLSNIGVISAGVGGNAILNNGIISTMTNTGTVSVGAGGVGITNNQTIDTLNNGQGSGNANGALSFSLNLPKNYNIILGNNAGTYGKLSVSNAMSWDGVSGKTDFGIYGGLVKSSTYSEVISGVDPSFFNYSSLSGSYGGYLYNLVLENGTAGTTNVWDLLFPAYVASTNILPGSTNYLSGIVDGSLNPIFSGGTLTLLNGDTSSQNFFVESSGGVISSPTAGSATLSGVFSGPGAMTFNGSGTTYMNGINTYTGGTTVASGTLSVGSSEANNTARLAGDVTVQSAGTLAGHGGIIGNVSNSGTVAPGGSIGTLSVGGNYIQTSGGTLSTSITPTENSVLAVTGKAAIAGTFSIDASSGVYTKRSYTVLTSSGLTGKFSNVTGNLASYSPLGTYLSYDANNAYLELVASRVDTQQSLINTASVLQGIYTLQNSVLVNGFSYDCNLFGANDVCISAGGRNTSVQAEGMNNTSALLIAAYRPAPNYRVGAWADQNLAMNSPGGTVKLGNNTPVLGVFGAWNEKLDGSGTEIKVAAGYGQKNTTITRSVVGTSDAGSGSSNLTTQGAQLQAKYGFALLDNTMISPYAGVRYTQSNMGGYSESYNTNVTAPLTYQALNTNATTLIAGAGISYKPIPVTTLFASAGIETDTATSNGSYSASSIKIAGLAPINFNANPVKTRPTATVGAYYDVQRNQRLGVSGIYRQEPFRAVSTTTVMATYTVGL